eukprot:gene920-1786_t
MDAKTFVSEFKLKCKEFYDNKQYDEIVKYICQSVKMGLGHKGYKPTAWLLASIMPYLRELLCPHSNHIYRIKLWDLQFSTIFIHCISMGCLDFTWERHFKNLISKELIHSDSLYNGSQGIISKSINDIQVFTDSISKNDENFLRRMLIKCPPDIPIIHYIDEIGWSTSINILDSQNRTPLHVAANMLHTDAIIYLVRGGSSISQRDSNSHTALFTLLRALSLSSWRKRVTSEQLLSVISLLMLDIQELWTAQEYSTSSSSSDTDVIMSTTTTSTSSSSLLAGTSPVCMTIRLNDDTLSRGIITVAKSKYTLEYIVEVQHAILLVIKQGNNSMLKLLLETFHESLFGSTMSSSSSSLSSLMSMSVSVKDIYGQKILDSRLFYDICLAHVCQSNSHSYSHSKCQSQHQHQDHDKSQCSSIDILKTLISLSALIIGVDNNNNNIDIDNMEGNVLSKSRLKEENNVNSEHQSTSSSLYKRSSDKNINNNTNSNTASNVNINTTKSVSFHNSNNSNNNNNQQQQQQHTRQYHRSTIPTVFFAVLRGDNVMVQYLTKTLISYVIKPSVIGSTSLCIKYNLWSSLSSTSISTSVSTLHHVENIHNYYGNNNHGNGNINNNIQKDMKNYENSQFQSAISVGSLDLFSLFSPLSLTCLLNNYTLLNEILSSLWDIGSPIAKCFSDIEGINPIICCILSGSYECLQIFSKYAEDSFSAWITSKDYFGYDILDIMMISIRLRREYSKTENLKETFILAREEYLKRKDRWQRLVIRLKHPHMRPSIRLLIKQTVAIDRRWMTLAKCVIILLDGNKNEHENRSNNNNNQSSNQSQKLEEWWKKFQTRVGGRTAPVKTIKFIDDMMHFTNYNQIISKDLWIEVRNIFGKNDGDGVGRAHIYDMPESRISFALRLLFDWVSVIIQDGTVLYNENSKISREHLEIAHYQLLECSLVNIESHVYFAQDYRESYWNPLHLLLCGKGGSSSSSSIESIAYVMKLYSNIIYGSISMVHCHSSEQYETSDAVAVLIIEADEGRCLLKRDPDGIPPLLQLCRLELWKSAFIALKYLSQWLSEHMEIDNESHDDIRLESLSVLCPGGVQAFCKCVHTRISNDIESSHKDIISTTYVQDIEWSKDIDINDVKSVSPIDIAIYKGKKDFVHVFLQYFPNTKIPVNDLFDVLSMEMPTICEDIAISASIVSSISNSSSTSNIQLESLSSSIKNETNLKLQDIFTAKHSRRWIDVKSFHASNAHRFIHMAHTSASTSEALTAMLPKSILINDLNDNERQLEVEVQRTGLLSGLCVCRRNGEIILMDGSTVPIDIFRSDISYLEQVLPPPLFSWGIRGTGHTIGHEIGARGDIEAFYAVLARDVGWKFLCLDIGGSSPVFEAISNGHIHMAEHMLQLEVQVQQGRLVYPKVPFPLVNKNNMDSCVLESLQRVQKIFFILCIPFSSISATQRLNNGSLLDSKRFHEVTPKKLREAISWSKIIELEQIVKDWLHSNCNFDEKTPIAMNMFFWHDTSVSLVKVAQSEIKYGCKLKLQLQQQRVVGGIHEQSETDATTTKHPSSPSSSHMLGACPSSSKLFAVPRFLLEETKIVYRGAATHAVAGERMAAFLDSWSTDSEGVLMALSLAYHVLEFTRVLVHTRVLVSLTHIPASTSTMSSVVATSTTTTTSTVTFNIDSKEENTPPTITTPISKDPSPTIPPPPPPQHHRKLQHQHQHQEVGRVQVGQQLLEEEHPIDQRLTKFIEAVTYEKNVLNQLSALPCCWNNISSNNISTTNIDATKTTNTTPITQNEQGIDMETGTGIVGNRYIRSQGVYTTLTSLNKVSLEDFLLFLTIESEISFRFSSIRQIILESFSLLLYAIQSYKLSDWIFILSKSHLSGQDLFDFFRNDMTREQQPQQQQSDNHNSSTSSNTGGATATGNGEGINLLDPPISQGAFLILDILQKLRIVDIINATQNSSIISNICTSNSTSNSNGSNGNNTMNGDRIPVRKGMKQMSSESCIREIGILICTLSSAIDIDSNDSNNASKSSSTSTSTRNRNVNIQDILMELHPTNNEINDLNRLLSLRKQDSNSKYNSTTTTSTINILEHDDLFQNLSKDLHIAYKISISCIRLLQCVYGIASKNYLYRSDPQLWIAATVSVSVTMPGSGSGSGLLDTLIWHVLMRCPELDRYDDIIPSSYKSSSTSNKINSNVLQSQTNTVNNQSNTNNNDTITNNINDTNNMKDTQIQTVSSTSTRQRRRTHYERVLIMLLLELDLPLCTPEGAVWNCVDLCAIKQLDSILISHLIPINLFNKDIQIHSDYLSNIFYNSNNSNNSNIDTTVESLKIDFIRSTSLILSQSLQSFLHPISNLHKDPLTIALNYEISTLSSISHSGINKPTATTASPAREWSLLHITIASLSIDKLHVLLNHSDEIFRNEMLSVSKLAYVPGSGFKGKSLVRSQSPIEPQLPPPQLQQPPTVGTNNINSSHGMRREEMDVFIFDKHEYLHFPPLKMKMTPLQVCIRMGAVSCVRVLLEGNHRHRHRHRDGGSGIDTVTDGERDGDIGVVVVVVAGNEKHDDKMGVEGELDEPGYGDGGVIVTCDMAVTVICYGYGGDEMGALLLQYLCKNKSREKLLVIDLEAAADNEPRLEGNPLLCVASRRGWTKTVSQLIAIGVNISAIDSAGLTALQCSMACGEKAVTRILSHKFQTENKSALKITWAVRMYLAKRYKLQSIKKSETYTLDDINAEISKTEKNLKMLESNPEGNQMRIAQQYGMLGIYLQLKDTRYHVDGGQTLKFEALKAFQHALSIIEIDKRFVKIRVNIHHRMAISLKSMGLGDEALQSLDIVYSQSTHSYDKWVGAFHRAGTLTMLGRVREARDWYAMALEIRPDFVTVYFNLVKSLRELNENTTEEWRFLLQKVIKQYKYSTKHPVSSSYDEEAFTYVPSSDSTSIHWAIFEIADTIGEYNIAWKYLSIAQKIEKDKQLPYNKSPIANRLQILKSIFTTRFFNNIPIIGSTTVLPVFIIGMMRSGSTLIETMLDAHKEIYGMGEDTIFGVKTNILQGILMKYQGKEITNEKLLVDVGAFGDYIANEMKTLAVNMSTKINITTQTMRNNQIKHVIDKHLFNYWNIGFIHYSMPNAVIIHTVRDPLDTILSIYKNKLSDHEVEWAHDPEDLVFEYVAYLEILAHFRAVLPGRVIDVRYEETVKDPEKTIRYLISRLNLEWDPNVMEFYKTNRTVQTLSVSQVRQNIYTKSVGSWRRYAKHMKPFIDAFNKYIPDLMARDILPFPDQLNWKFDPDFDYGFGPMIMPDDEKNNEKENLKIIATILRRIFNEIHG